MHFLNAKKAILLDLDGTLIDSNDAHAHAWQRALGEEGFVVPFDEIRRRIGMGGDLLLPQLTDIQADSPWGRRLNARRGEIFREYLPEIVPFPKAHELLRFLRAQGLRLVIATSASEEDLHEALAQADLEGCIDAATNASDVENSKPEPDVICAALEKAGVRPSQALMIGDTPYDLRAARRAGVDMIGLTCGGWSPEDLHGCLAIFADPRDLLRALQGEKSPSAQL